MAYVKILAIRCDESYLGSAVGYAVSADKTMEQRLHIAGEYAADPDKTALDEVRYASFLNLSSGETAAAEMMATKQKHGKTEGRLGYHVIQSFSPDDHITPEQAHEIGVRYAKELFGDYEVVIGTHVDRSHVHNHIVLNSVSCADGRKVHLPKGYLTQVMREVSDRYCQEYGLSVIEWTEGRAMARRDWALRHFRKGSFRESINRDIREAASLSGSVAGLLVGLENKGYAVDSTGMYTKIKPPDGKKYWRLKTFYTEEELEAMVKGGAAARMGAAKQPRLSHTCRLQRGSVPRPRRLTRFEGMYLRWLALLGEQRRGRHTPLPRGEYRKAEQYTKQLAFLSRHGLAKLSQVIAYRTELEARYKTLNTERYRLAGRKEKYGELFEAHRTVTRLRPILHETDGAARAAYKQAMAVLEKNGYGENPDGLSRLRVELEERILANKHERMDVREQIGRCKAAEGASRRMEPVLREEARQAKERTQARQEPQEELRGRARDRDLEH